MNTTIRFGRIRGIDIGANWTFVFIFGLVTWTLAAEILPTMDEGRSAMAYWTVAGTIAALFFASLIAHEMGHALVARRNGVEVHEITLWLLGGVSKLESSAVTAGIEGRIAIAGPLVSITLGIVWSMAAVVTAMVGVPDLLVGAFVWLSFINLVLAVFNCLPAFPLDGGRVLRALLWWQSGNRLDATARAARVGEVIAYCLIALGFLQVFAGASIGGLWLALIGWFVIAAGRAETEAVREQDLLEGVRVRDVMSLHPAVVPAGIDAARFVDRYVLAGHHTSYPVVDDSGHTVGLVTVDRIRSLSPDTRAVTTLRQVAIPREDLPSIDPDAPAIDLVPLLTGGPARKILVFEGDGLVGIVSGVDLARALQNRAARASLLGSTR